MTVTEATRRLKECGWKLDYMRPVFDFKKRKCVYRVWGVEDTSDVQLRVYGETRGEALQCLVDLVEKLTGKEASNDGS